MLLGGAAFWGANKQALGLFHDDGIYTVVAKSLYQGDGYRIISVPSSPPQTKYPFLYSYLLSWVWAVKPAFPDNIIFLKALNILILSAIFVIGVAYYRRRLPASSLAALLFGTIICTNPIIFTFTDYVVSDLLFVLLSLVALYLSCSPLNFVGRSGQTVTLGLVTGLACLTRLAAAPLVFAGAVQAFVARSWRGAVTFACLTLLISVPWILWVSFGPSLPPDSLFAYYGAYDFAGIKIAGAVGPWFDRHRLVIAGNARYLIGSFDLLYLLQLLPGFGIVVAVFSAVGLIGLLRREEVFNWGFFLSSVALLMFWPFHPSRYIAPLVPVLVLFFFHGMAITERWIKSKGGEFSAWGIVAKMAWCPGLLVLLLNGVWLSGFLLIKDEQSTRGLYGNRVAYGWRGFEESFAWVRENTEPDALLATAYDPMYYLYTGRRAIRPALHRSATYFYPYGQANPDVGSSDEIRPQLDKLGIKYLIIDPLDGYVEGKATLRLFDQLVKSYGARATHVFTSSDGKHRIYVLN